MYIPSILCVCRHKHVLKAEYGIPNVHTLSSEKPLLHISHGLCILLQFFVIAGSSTHHCTGGYLMLYLQIKGSVCLFSVFLSHTIWYMEYHGPGRCHSSSSLMVAGQSEYLLFQYLQGSSHSTSLMVHVYSCNTLWLQTQARPQLPCTCYLSELVKQWSVGNWCTV